jgi:hypothetical protein
MTPKGHLNLPIWINNLSHLLGDRFKRTGSTGDLEKAISKTEQVIDAMPKDHIHRAASLNGLSNKLGHRYRLTGRIVDLGSDPPGKASGRCNAQKPAR